MTWFSYLRLALSATLSAIAINASALAQGRDVHFEGVLAAAKYSGFCGVVSSMVRFQEETKMPGGDAFVARFMSTEAARQGKTIDEIGTQCKWAVGFYNDLVGLAAAEKK